MGGGDLEIQLPLRYLIPEMIRQQGVARILEEIARVWEVKAGRLIWNANDWTGLVDKRGRLKR